MTTFSLADVRLPPLASPASTRRRSSSAFGLELGEDKYSRRKAWGSTRSYVGVVRGIKIALGLVVFCVCLFFWTTQIHIEIQAFSRGWIKHTILPIAPLTSSCFSPGIIAASSYNTTLASSPSFVELHAGLGMEMGNDCYHFASTVPYAPLKGMVLPRHTIFHLYWRGDLLPLGARQMSLLHSLLATQDRASTSVIFWTNVPPTTAAFYPLVKPLLGLYGERFSIQTIDKTALARGTPMEKHALLEVSDKKAWLDGDLVRVLVLWAKGGIWVDFDTIMTGRDMRVLGEHEWVTQWDCHDKIYNPLNGAMMHFYQNSPYLCEMLHTMSTSRPPREGTTDWGSHLYHAVWRRLVANSIVPFQVLPYCFTDGYSCRLDNRLPDPFRPRDQKWGKGRPEELRKKVDSIFAVHLHNRWEKEFPKDGWVRKLILDKVEEAVKHYGGEP